MDARSFTLERDHTIDRDSERESDESAMMTRTQLAELQVRPDASPGLLRRRYSVPETVMRKYRLAQQSSDSEECAPLRSCAPSPPRDNPRSAGESPRHLRRDRELMRRSALLRRMWARPPPPPHLACRCERASPSPSTAPASPDSSAPTHARDIEDDSDTFSASLPTARETPRLLAALHPYELLEVVVSESASSSPPRPTPAPAHAPARARTPLPQDGDLDLDEYVSRVLMESLNSLSDRLECMNAAVGADRQLSVLEKEIKVRLQNAAVNTIVHLSPTSNHQIIFGNEELCDPCDPASNALRDPCNNPLTPATSEDNNNNNNNASPTPTPTPTPALTPTPRAFDAVIQRDSVNRAVLQQIQKLFRDELRRETSPRSDDGAVSLIEIRKVAVESLSPPTRESGAGEPVGGVGAGNYFRDVDRAAVVPRRCALPHSASMEVNASSSEGAEVDALGSDATSLADSLDEPESPRGRGPRQTRDRSAAFFVRIRDGVGAAPQPARVAECMPERIRQKLQRRQRERELRNESARRGKVRQLRERLARRPEPPPAPRRPARLYHKSEIREGDKCIEILEILEYSTASRSSSSGAADESADRLRARRSRIPVPVPALTPPDRVRLARGAPRVAPPLAELLLCTIAPPAPPPVVPEPRERSNSLRFKRVFDVIPEERNGLGCDSPANAEESQSARRASAPTVVSLPAPAPAPALSPPATRSAGTSPPSQAETRRKRSQTTMTSPSSKSAATSPWRPSPRAPPPEPPSRPPPPREGIVCALRPPLLRHRTASLAVE